MILRNPNSKDEILISIEHCKESNTLRDWSKRISGEYLDMTFQYRELRPYTAPFYSVIKKQKFAKGDFMIYAYAIGETVFVIKNNTIYP